MCLSGSHLADVMIEMIYKKMAWTKLLDVSGPLLWYEVRWTLSLFTTTLQLSSSSNHTLNAVQYLVLSKRRPKGMDD
jgi:hypothetical protein